MGLLDEMTTDVSAVFSKQWEVKKARTVPEPESLKLSNDARYFERATILYADLSGSTKLVNEYSWEIAGEVYKTFLLCAAKLIRSFGASITSYDGDRIMAVFAEGMQTSNAAKCAMQINWSVKNVIQPAFQKQYPKQHFTIKHVVGIDTSEIRAARIGVRGGNDLVWIGRAANYAAKLTECRNDYQTFITKEAFDYLKPWAKNGGSSNTLMWKEMQWVPMNNIPVYGSIWSWVVE